MKAEFNNKTKKWTVKTGWLFNNPEFYMGYKTYYSEGIEVSLSIFEGSEIRVNYNRYNNSGWSGFGISTPLKNILNDTGYACLRLDTKTYPQIKLIQDAVKILLRRNNLKINY